ncbi:MAG: hypothetical protein Q9162_005724 [Coniocarpon cinnabarinum]
MDVSPTSAAPMRPPNGTQILKNTKLSDASKKSSGSATGAAAAVSNPKVVQSAFVHKLYNMLEDKTISHLITWSSSNDSFLMSPSTEFSKVLSTYFKHTNIASFVRQLNMYGFHKVSDVFHTGSSETTLWEFKHGQGHFKKGDLDSLRDIKRRASRHALIHRDSFPSSSKPSIPQPPLPPELPADTTEARLGMLEQNLYDMHGRLARSEENGALMAARCQELTDQLATSYHHNQELSANLASLVEDPHHPVRRSISQMQNEIQRHLDALRRPSVASTSPHSQTYHQRPPDSSPTSPHALAYDDRRRASIQFPQRDNRPLEPSPMRHGSFGTARSSPGSGRLAPPPPPAFSQQPTPPPPMQHPQVPSVAVEPPPYLPRRHTSADILSTNEWTSQHRQSESREPALPSPFGSAFSNGGGGVPYPGNGDRQLQDKLNSYTFGGASTQSSVTLPPPVTRDRGSVSHQSSRAPSPPPAHLAPPQPTEPPWAQPPAVRMPFRDVFRSSGLSSPVSSGAPTRRSSMANIHNIMNPADSADADDGEEDQRKRKRRA